MSFYGYTPYVSVGEKKKKVQKSLEKLRKKNPDISPVEISGNKITTTWWGNAWCKNLESYADFSNRIGRGKSYVKNGFVLDLRISEGVVDALVYGSELYSVTIKIDKLTKKNLSEVTTAIGRKISSMEDLIAGNFPKEFGDAFLKQGGLFPAPKNIKMKCDCPDGARMCKHVAAVLYGAGARLDSEPLLFFKLRGIDVGEFVAKSIDDKMSSLFRNAGAKTERVIEGCDLFGLFGV